MHLNLGLAFQHSSMDTDTDFPGCPQDPGVCLLPLHSQRCPGMSNSLVIILTIYHLLICMHEVYMFLYSIYCRKWDNNYQLRKIKFQITNFLSRQNLNVQYRCGSCNKTSESIRIIFWVVSKVDIIMYLINWMNVDRRVG